MKRARVLVADDQLEMARMVADGLADHGYDAVAAGSGREAIALLESDPFDAVVTDLRMSDAGGLDVLAASKARAPERPVIVMTAYSALETAIESIRRGAHHYLTKPFKTDELLLFLGRALDEREVRREAKALRQVLRERSARGGIAGKSKAIRTMLDIVDRVADSPMPVLITGETGTGKGLVARALHAGSARAQGPFVAVNCAALPEALLESELFGHVKGAFTGATSHRPGLFLEASGGTLFLDEIGELALPLQAKLLRAIESGSVRPVGAEKEQRADVRFVAATNRDLALAAREGTFREDLRYRLDVVSVEVPPLRRRREDLVELIDTFLESARAAHPRAVVRGFSREAIERLARHDWPGNVRELEHLVSRVVVLGKTEEVGVADLPAPLLDTERAGPIRFTGEVLPMREVQRRYAAWALAELGGQKGKTAERLGIDGKTLAKWLSEE